MLSNDYSRCHNETCERRCRRKQTSNAALQISHFYEPVAENECEHFIPPLEGECYLCGCTDNKACVHPDLGPCWWVDESHNLCSHCYIDFDVRKSKSPSKLDKLLEDQKEACHETARNIHDSSELLKTQ